MKEIKININPTTQEDFEIKVSIDRPLDEMATILENIAATSQIVTFKSQSLNDCFTPCYSSFSNGLLTAFNASSGFDDAISCGSGLGTLIGQGINSISSGKNQFFSNNAYSYSQFGTSIANTATSCLLVAGKNVPMVKAINIATSLANYGFLIKDAADCFNCNNDTENIYPIDLNKKTKTVGSTTPEDKYGPIGASVSISDSTAVHYIDTSKVFEYRIDYWNKEDATAPAAIVYIRDTLDTDFNLQTLNFTEVGFLKWKVKLEGGQYFNVNVDCRPEMPYIVNIEGTVDPETREVYWVHTTLDPTTMDLPEDPLSGYLPPIDSTGYQIGWVSYTIKANSNLPDGTVFTNQAHVNFDGVGKWGPAPKEGPYTNIFDMSMPSSYVNPLPAVQDSLSFTIHLKGQDDGSGIEKFDIYVADNNNEFKLWKSTADSTTRFTGEQGHTYKYFVVATDRVGNREVMKTQMEAYTFVSQTAVGINQMETQQRGILTIYPNPTNGKTTVALSSEDAGTLVIRSMTGNVIFGPCQFNGYEQVDLSGVSKGIYIATVKCSKESYSGKIVVR